MLVMVVTTTAAAAMFTAIIFAISIVFFNESIPSAFQLFLCLYGHERIFFLALDHSHEENLAVLHVFQRLDREQSNVEVLSIFKNQKILKLSYVAFFICQLQDVFVHLLVNLCH